MGTDPGEADTDQDGIQDGTESGFTMGIEDPDGRMPLKGTGEGFVPDLDPSTITEPLNPDTDGNGINDGAEDKNYNGRVDLGETNPAKEKILKVPEDFPSIQSALNNGHHGDTILVAPGVYNVGATPIDFSGKRIALISKERPEKTILESNGESVSGPTGRIVVFVSGETQDTVIAGFTTRRGLNIQERFLFIITCFGIMLPGRIIPPVHWNMGGDIYW